MSAALRELTNGRVTLALHALAPGEGTPLLMLHALYGSSADWGDAVEAWPGPVFGLDFSGHGRSGRLRGGCYDWEPLLSDADTALHAVGPAAVAGAGLGAWHALLLAGARADRVPACLLAPGRGLDGAGPAPDPLDVRRRIPRDDEAEAHDAGSGTPDPYTRGLEAEPRPPVFARPFAAAARRVLLVEDGGARPPWWEAVREAGGAPCGPDLPAGLAALARASR